MIKPQLHDETGCDGHAQPQPVQCYFLACWCLMLHLQRSSVSGLQECNWTADCAQALLLPLTCDYTVVLFLCNCFSINNLLSVVPIISMIRLDIVISAVVWKEQGPEYKHTNLWGYINTKTQCRCGCFLLQLHQFTCRWSQRFTLADLLCSCTYAPYYILIHTQRYKKVRHAPDIFSLSESQASEVQ